jgi:hypothetical protein
VPNIGGFVFYSYNVQNAFAKKKVFLDMMCISALYAVGSLCLEHIIYIAGTGSWLQGAL